MKRGIISIFILLLASIYVSAQQLPVISGTITNRNGKPIRGVMVRILSGDKNLYASTDSLGEYSLKNIPVGKNEINFSFTGHKPNSKSVKLSAGEEYQLNISLEEDYFLLGEITVKTTINRGGEVRRLNDIYETFIAAGRKNEVVQVEGMNANIPEKTGRQIFAKIPGTFVYDMDGSGNQVNISTRGLDPHRSWEYNIRQNGIITNSDIYGYPASHYSPPMESIRKVEIIRGTASLQYGAGFGGMINYVTKSADTTRKISFESITSAGSFGMMSTYNAVGGKTGKLSYYGYFSLRKSDGYRDNGESNYGAQYAGLTYQFNRSISLKAELGHMKYVYQVPGPLTDSMFASNPRQSTRSRNYFNPNIYVPSLTLDWKISEATQLNMVASALLGRRNSVQFLGFANVPDTINKTTGRYATRQVDIDGFNSFTAELRLLHRYSTGRIDNAVSAGVRLINNTLHRRQLGTGTSGTDFDLSLSTPGFGRDLEFNTKNIAFFVENLISISKRFSVTPGVRYENGNSLLSGTISYYDPGDVPNKIHHQFPLFGITTQYNFGKSNRLYGGWAEAYRPVLFSDIIPATTLDRVDKNLDDAKGYTAELGVNGSFKNFLKYDVGFFALQYSNRIGTMIATDGSGNPYILKTNVGSSLTTGMELFAELDGKELFSLGDFRWSLFTSTSFMDARYLEGNVVISGTNKSVKGNRLETVPSWISRNGLNIGYKTFHSTIQISHVSKSFSDALNTVIPNPSGSAGIVPAYTLVDVNASYRVNTEVVLKLGLNNAFNRQYFTKRPSGYPGPGVWSSDGRSVVASLHVKL